MPFPFLAAAIGAGALGSFLKRDKSQQNFEFQQRLQRNRFGFEASQQQRQFGENQLGRDQQQGFFDFRSTERRGIREGQLGEIGRLRGLMGTGGISQLDQDRLTQQNNLQVNRNVGGFANSLARRFGGLNQPGIRSALFGNQLGQQQQFSQNLQQQNLSQISSSDAQLRQLITSLFGGLRG